MKKVLLIILFLIVIVAGGAYVMISTGEKVDVVWTENDFETALDKTQIQVETVEEINLLTLAKGDFTVSGTNAVDVSFTNSEMSALIDKANANGGPIKDFRVAFNGNNEGEISFKLTDAIIDFLEEENILSQSDFGLITNYMGSPVASVGSVTDTIVNFISGIAANKPVYASGTLVKDSNNSVTLNISSLKVGQVVMSQSVIDRVESETLRFVNGLLSEVNGISIEELRVENGELYYKGTLPAEIKGVKLQ